LDDGRRAVPKQVGALPWPHGAPPGITPNQESPMSITRAFVVTGLALAAATACVDRSSPIATGPDSSGAVETAPPQAGARRPERLARLFARALRNPAFRSYLKAQLDSSPFPEHKIQLQGFLAARGRRALQDLATENATSVDDVEGEAARAIPLEVYLPVPAHRAAWTGDDHVLVATALQDREAPVAFSPNGARTILSPDHPPATPVIAVVPVETDFSAPPRAKCSGEACNPDGGGSTSSVGLFMTKAHFDDDYEGWLKGAPEYEIHVLGQLGSTDSLTDYQCAGALAGGPYAFNQDENDWSGSVLLFSQKQLDSYKAAHPGQSLRILALEDDDTACKIVTNKNDLESILLVADSLYSSRTGGRDTTTTSGKYYKAAKVLRTILTYLASFIKTNDDLIGTAIEDDVVGKFYSGYNWIIKGKDNITHGWINLEMR
jgi:hypothetical protein